MIGEMLKFPVCGGTDSSPVAFEKGADFPFEIKRGYDIWGMLTNIVRGDRANKNLEQVVVCTPGSCDCVRDYGAFLRAKGILLESSQ